MKNYYAVLGLTLKATDDEIKAAYRQNAKRYHPDLNPENESYRARFLEIKAAYEILGNPEKKKSYDEQIMQRLKQRAEQSQYQNQAQPQYQNQNQPQYQNQNQAYANGYFPPENMQFDARATRPIPSHIRKMEDVKKLHALQLDLMRASAKDNMRKYKKQLSEQLQKYKTQTKHEQEKQQLKYKATIDALNQKLQTLKNQKETAAFNEGFKRGVKTAQESSKTTISELKSLLSQSVNVSKDKNSDKLFRAVQMELSLMNEKNRELTEQLKILDNAAKDSVESESVESLKEQLAAAQQTADELLSEKESTIQANESLLAEIDFLNDEILHLEGLIDLWQHISADNSITQEELEMLANYESLNSAQKGTLYGDLGLPLNALPDEIAAAFSRLEKRYKGKSAFADKLLAINTAYKTLSDPKLKAAYDEQINNASEL